MKFFERLSNNCRMELQDVTNDKDGEPFYEDVDGVRMIDNITSDPAAIRAKEFVKDCFFCKEEITEINSNDSHWTPNSYLKIISDQRFKVSSVNPVAALNTNDPENFLGSKVSTKSASIFFGTCGECDGPNFRDYERSPNFALNNTTMRQIALKTVIASRYFSLYDLFASLERMEYIRSEICNSPLKTLPDDVVESWLSTQDGFIKNDRSWKGELLYSRLLSTIAEQLEKSTTFTKIIDIEIPGKPVIAIHSLFPSSEKFFYVNVFPTKAGSRILIFVEGAISRKDYRSVKDTSVLQSIAFSTLLGKQGIYLSPDFARSVRDGKVTYELFSPRSLGLNQAKIRRMSITNLSKELNIDDPRVFMNLKDHCVNR